MDEGGGGGRAGEGESGLSLNRKSKEERSGGVQEGCSAEAATAFMCERKQF